MTGTTRHHWYPSSPCGCGCLPPERETVPAPVLAGRCIRLALALASAPVLLGARPWLPGRAKGIWQRAFSRQLLGALGITVRVHDRRGGLEQGRAQGLIVSNHISWLDPLVISTTVSASFVARADLVEWPVIGSMARWARTIPVRRESLRDLPQALDLVTERLRRGERVAVFPEGTTWCGRSWGRLRPAFFQSAIDAGAWVHPVHVRYLTSDGETTTVPSFVGDDGLAASIGRVLSQRSLVVELTLLAPELAVGDRKLLAQRCDRSLRSAERDTGLRLVDVDHAERAAA
ncbi:lysophospholipid acyltransferase family protein [Lolliginicoccus suaedae]|uniref:lysophospholipid acyltransferase family protein n=1 Tax=Lolliginicoccus suaedae TaxID=2605429 RepID=UPI0011EC0974|nr:lysophospholipid acyltransferase family protein [Lolliginicoccus suaedae]